MKQFYGLLFLIALTNYNAQTLTQAFNEPVVGDVDKNYRLDTSAYMSGLPTAVTGTNCVWNYSNLTGTFPIVVDSFISPSAAPGASAYPSATFVQHRDLLYSYFKSSTSPSQTELYGAYSPSLTLTFTNSAIIASYPVAYGYNLSDPVSGSFKYNTINGACNGNITISADGIGTIQLPNNVTIPNILCLRSVEILTLSTGIVPFGTYNQTIINYYMPGRKYPILNMNYKTYQLIAGSPTITAYVYGSDNYYTIAGVSESSKNEENYKVYPNPFHDRLFLKSAETKGENDYFIYNMNGGLIVKTKSLADIEFEKLLPGIYFLEIKNKAVTYHQKIIKE